LVLGLAEYLLDLLEVGEQVLLFLLHGGLTLRRNVLFLDKLVV
jgi:hypothetical protein